MEFSSFGKTGDGREAHLVTLRNKTGMEAVFTTFGARLVSFLCPDREGKLADVCLGFNTLKEYETRKGFLGATIGRFGNRIGGAAFSLNGKAYQLFANDGANTLHGGQAGFDRKIWGCIQESASRAVFTYTSPDGEEGFPGTLDVKVAFTLMDDGSLVIDYRAVCDSDTALNLTNHAYFNLAGEGTIHNHTLQVLADTVTATTEDLIPTGDFLPVAGTPYDLREPRLLGEALAQKGNAMFDSALGFDINYVLRGKGFREVAVLAHPGSGRVLRVLTDQPGLQVYSGQGNEGEYKVPSLSGSYIGIALETQHFPDSVNQPRFPSTVLKAGEEYKTCTVYRFSAE